MFSLEAIKSIRESGTIVASSRFLVDKMTKNIKDQDNVIIEFGTGDEKITKTILKKTSCDSKVLSFELNQIMFKKANVILPQDNRLCVINDSAQNFDHVLKEHHIKKVDYFISSLPLSLLKKTDIESLLSKVNQHLHSGGMFIQYQYSLDKLDLLKSHFSDVKVRFTPLNIPPAFIYYCKI